MSVDNSDGANQVIEGNGQFEAQVDPAVPTNNTDTTIATFPKRVEQTVTVNGAAPYELEFTKWGVVTPERTICVFSTYDPDYDCIIVSRTRINMGKIANQGNPCQSANCDAK
jgi:hypothetical protein